MTSENTDLVVETLDEAERDFVLGSAIGGEPIPVTLDHFDEVLVGLESLARELGTSIVEELARRGFARVVPQTT
jgi:hypothetical protein